MIEQFIQAITKLEVIEAIGILRLLNITYLSADGNSTPKSGEELAVEISKAFANLSKREQKALLKITKSAGRK